MVSQARGKIAKATLAVLIAPSLFAAATFPTTTLRIDLVGWPAAQQPSEVVYLASNAAFVPGQNPVSGGIGNPSGHTNQILFLDTEAMCVTGPITPSGGIPVSRACQGTSIGGHNAGATVFVGYPSYYPSTIPYGRCSVYSVNVLPVVYILNAGVYNCVAGTWTYEGQVAAYHPLMVRVPMSKMVCSCSKPWYRKLGAWLKRNLT